MDTYNGLKQIVPSALCLTCDVCCRFPEETSFLAPFFMQHEIAQLGPPARPRFDSPQGSKIKLARHGDGCICPYFDPVTQHCGIYTDRPLDCRIYPFALMRDPEGAVVLGIDTKCPYIQEHAQDAQMAKDADAVAQFLESGPIAALWVAHPALIGPFQDDVIILRPLSTESHVASARGATSSSGEARQDAALPQVRTESVGVRSMLSSAGLQPFSLEARAVLPRHTGEAPLSAYAYATHALWQDHFSFYWAEMSEHFLLFAEYDGCLYMPMPPLGPRDPALVARCFAWMNEKNEYAARIENIPEGDVFFYQSCGLRLRPKEGEYLYLREALVNLRGDAYKTPRWACHTFAKRYPPTERPYAAADAADALALFYRWKAHRTARYDDPIYRQMLCDSEAVHRRALSQAQEMGLTGHIVEVEGRIVGYTFGFPLDADTFCIALEVTDLNLTGAAAFLFRAFCSTLTDYTWINTMDDSGLPNLRRIKEAYRPARQIASYSAAMPGGQRSDEEVACPA